METTALGAAYFAGLATGYWDSIESLMEQSDINKRFSPGMDEDLINTHLNRWEKALERSKGWKE
jgi:glycerol kinase